MPAPPVNAPRDKAAKYLSPRKGIGSPRLFYAAKTCELLLSARRKLNRGVDPRRHPAVSLAAYETYDDWEMRAYQQGATWTWTKGRMALVRFTTIRAAYLAPVIAEITRLAAERPGQPLRILEVGCGNGTNLMLLKQAHPGADLHGIDISPARMRVGRAYWGDRLDGVGMTVDSAITLETLGDAAFDLVYSVHCLEQLPYHADLCIAAMARVARGPLVLVEPVFEFANTAQRLYAILGDQLRTLLPAIRANGLTIRSSTPATVLAHPLNCTGIVIAQRPATP